MDSVKFSLYQRLNIIGIAMGILYFALRYGALPSYNSPEYSSAPTSESPVLQPTTAKPVASPQAIEKNITIDVNDVAISGYAITNGSILRIVGWDANDEALEVHFENFKWIPSLRKNGITRYPSRDAFLEVPITVNNKTNYYFEVNFKTEDRYIEKPWGFTYVSPRKRLKEKTLFDVTNQADHELVLSIAQRGTSYRGRLFESIVIPLLYTPPVPANINPSYEDRVELPPRLAREALPPSSPITASTIDINELSETGYLIDNGSLVSIMGWDDPESVLEVLFDHFQWSGDGFSFTVMLHNRVQLIGVNVFFVIDGEFMNNSVSAVGIIPTMRRRTYHYSMNVEKRDEYLFKLLLNIYKSSSDTGLTEQTLVIPFIYRPAPTIAEDIVASPSEASNEPLSVSQSATPTLEYLFSYADISMTIDDLIQLVPLINNRNLSDILEDSSINEDPHFVDILKNTSIKFIVANSSIVRIIPIADFDIETFMEWLGAISAESVGVTKVTYIVNYKDITYEGSFQIRVTE
ncbi:hypothetical protein [Entomospira culicis]|uniref:Uncharacterized protein n=1 Tax=Entomospira culicis TaxID=2719989 RepID=A0A968GFE3_9SPIO|nr:hypothetical protein [Entomospira culicis]NIZ19067.1 hypothetical protein [Entomospira culicis]NIZ69282.1 hypothetical protein [Entomospira culicis]WDI37867.1 hypothetical protein PVA46_03520 [Entomospira culicis]WDI39495.1 hypothetical protein PVA47_03525 [Entomospira culicis]